MEKIARLLIPFAACIFVLVGCDDDDSDNDAVISDGIATGEIYATFQIIADGDDDVYIEAQLTRGVPPSNSNDSETFIRLVDDDELWMSTGESIDTIDFSDDLFEEFQELSDTQVRLGEILEERERYRFLFDRLIINTFGDWYSATLPQSEERTYRVSLLREDNGRSASDSIVTLPPEFSIVAPASGERFSRSRDDIVIEWTNVDPESSVEAELVTTCSSSTVDTYSTIIDSDSGILTIAAGDLDSPLLAGVCSTTLNLRKIRVGIFDSRFVGGAVNGYQIRRQVFTTES